MITLYILPELGALVLFAIYYFIMDRFLVNGAKLAILDLIQMRGGSDELLQERVKKDLLPSIVTTLLFCIFFAVLGSKLAFLAVVAGLIYWGVKKDNNPGNSDPGLNLGE